MTLRRYAVWGGKKTAKKEKLGSQKRSQRKLVGLRNNDERSIWSRQVEIASLSKEATNYRGSKSQGLNDQASLKWVVRGEDQGKHHNRKKGNARREGS